ncbi:YybH family protein [Massilia horti]|uniref:SgcJ/EcaC family oxidoreductase n=1 Tax=Massilia horti TaxID=2562153 RepID=A0A4Y9T4A9_9BURK|nr:SgcJ/EcaC family oxidoreductase [Massilia horti]TFW32434.1 SgcJ/EcaC family oxidoreductase [Massilia horti]
MSNDEQEIRNLVQTWLRATREGDVDTIMSLMTPDVVFLMPGAPPMIGRAAYGDALRTVLGKHVIDASSQIDEVVVSGDLAYTRARLKITVTTKHEGTPTLKEGHTLSIMRRCDDGKWRLARDANLIAPGG